MGFDDWLTFRMGERNWQDVHLCAALADLGYSVKQYSVRNWLAGRCLPKANMVTGLCEIFACTPSDMFPLPKKQVA